MAYVITDECAGCGICYDGCPVDAITEEGFSCKIDQDICIECGWCVTACPCDAISKE